MYLYKFKGIWNIVVNHFSTAFLQHFNGFFTCFRRLFYKLLTGWRRKKSGDTGSFDSAAPQHQGYEKVISFIFSRLSLIRGALNSFD